MTYNIVNAVANDPAGAFIVLALLLAMATN